MTDHRRRLLEGLPVTERRIDVAGVSTPVLEGGAGAPLVLLHGPGEFAGKWRAILPGLVARYRVVAPDLPAHGESDLRGRGLDGGAALAWLEALLERTCPSPPAIVGHVLGGAMAARFAARWPQRLSRLVLVDSLGLAAFRPRPRFALTMAGFGPPQRALVRALHAPVLVRPRRPARPHGRPLATVPGVQRGTRPPPGRAQGRAAALDLGLRPIPHAELARLRLRRVSSGGGTTGRRRCGWPRRPLRATAGR